MVLPTLEKSKYALLEHNSSNDSFPSMASEATAADLLPQKERKMWSKVSIGSLLAIALSTIALSLSMTTATSTSQSTPQIQTPSERIVLGTCGRTWQEAESNGCVYDVMMTAWVRPECYDKELSDSFFYRDSASWTFFHDPEGTKVLPHEELFQGRYTEYWVQGTYHFSHCSYIWAKQMKQMGKRPMVLDSKARNWHHTLHCAGMLAEANTTYIGGRASSHAKLGTNSVDCIIGDWMVFESIPEEIQNQVGSGE